MTDYMSTATETEAKFFGMILGVQNTKPVRQWGFEIEHPSINTALNNTWSSIRNPFALVTDPSVPNEQEGCECGCRECSYHECNCDDCENYNDDPEHCGDDSCEGKNECSSADPIQTFWDDKFNNFIEYIREAESGSRWDALGENWSGHIHAEAKDLDREQLRALVVVGTHLLKIAPEWFTGWEDNYNDQTARENLDRWAKGENYAVSRQSWISVTNLAWTSVNPQEYNIGDRPTGKTTVEFRRFRVTLDPKLIMARGAVVRALVQWARDNNPKGIYWTLRHKNFIELCQAIGVGRH